MDAHWTLSEKWFDGELFFGELPHHLPDATTLFVQGSSIGGEVKSFFRAHAEAGDFLPKPGARGIGSRAFRCRFSDELCSGLQALSGRHAEEELCDHLFVYADRAPLLKFYDFPHNEIWLSGSLAEARVVALASAFGVEYEKG